MIYMMNKGLKVKALFLCLFFISQNCFADLIQWNELNDSLKRTAVKATDKTSIYLWASGLLGVSATHPQDDSFRAANGHHVIMSETTANFGDFLGTGLPGIFLAGVQYWGFDHKGGERHFSAIISTAIVTYTMKYSFGRRRPGDSTDHKSFPSGHTSTTFASATVLAYEYGWSAGLPAYAAAVFTGASRIADDAHWLSDTVGGAFIGFIWGRAAALNEQDSPVQSWLPFYEKGRAGVIFASHF